MQSGFAKLLAWAFCDEGELCKIVITRTVPLCVENPQ